MSDQRRVLLVGATGLVGRRVIARGRMIPGLAVTALSRRAMEMPRGGWASLLVAPTAEWSDKIGALAPDAVICALGTTKAKSGRAGLAAVDRDLVVEVARAARLAGARHFVFISSVGANSQSKSHYLRTKGQTELALRKLGFDRLDIMRPGLLRGQRHGDRRTGEKIASLLAPITDALLHGRWRRFRSISAGAIAAASLQAVRQGGAGRYTHTYDDIRDLASRLPVVHL